MFQLELIDLIKKFNLELDQENKNNILKQIGDISSQNPNKLNQMKNDGILDSISINIISQALKKKEENKTVEPNENTDLIKIKNSYMTWLENFRENQNQINPNCSKIVEEIVSFYAPNRFEIIQKIFEINDSLEFESFKNHIKNNLRVYFSQILKDYKNSQNYENLNFIKKFKKKKEIFHIIEDLSKYKFNIKKIQEVIKNE